MSNTNTPTQMREYRKRYRHKHPDRDKQQRINWVASIVAKGSKKCADCKKNKNIENYTHSKLHISAYCKPCQNLRAKHPQEFLSEKEYNYLSTLLMEAR